MSVKTQKPTNYQPPKEAIPQEAMDQFAKLLIKAMSKQLHIAQQKCVDTINGDRLPTSDERGLNQRFKSLGTYYGGKSEAQKEAINKFISKL